MNQRQLEILRTELDLVKQARNEIKEQAEKKDVDKDKLRQRSEELAKRLDARGINNISSFKKAGVATGKNIDELADKAQTAKRKSSIDTVSRTMMTTMRNMTLVTSAISSTKFILAAIGKAISVVSKWFSSIIQFLKSIGMHNMLKYASVGAVAYVVGWLLWKPIKRFINKARTEDVVKEDIQHCFDYSNDTNVLLEVTQLTEANSEDKKIQKLDTAINTCQEMLDLLSVGIMGTSLLAAILVGMSSFIWAMLIGSSLWVLLWVSKRQFERYKRLQTPYEEVM